VEHVALRLRQQRVQDETASIVAVNPSVREQETFGAHVASLPSPIATATNPALYLITLAGTLFWLLGDMKS
jgi:hypothetical protein